MLVEKTPAWRIAANVLDHKENAVFFVGYCDPDTPGGHLLAARQGDTILFETSNVKAKLKARIERFELSGHADREELIDFARELAQQVADDAIDLLKGSRGVRVATVVGGLPYGKQLQALRGADLVVATPGRLLDLYRTRKIRLDQVVHVVVDEADRMLDLGFAEDLQAIALASAQREQTLMFSATFAPRIMQLAEKLTKDPIRIAITALNQAKPDIRELIHLADHESHRIKLLEHYLSDSSVDQAVIFARTQVECEQLGEKLTAQGLSVTYLHGALPQSVRTRRLNAFREKRVQWLVATDVAARGRTARNAPGGRPGRGRDRQHRGVPGGPAVGSAPADRFGDRLGHRVLAAVLRHISG